MTVVASPRAARLSAPRWLDTRLVLGVLLVAASVVAGARVFTAADNLAGVYVAAHDLVPGEHLTAADVTVTRVRLPREAGLYVAAGATPPVGYVVTRFVGAHELVPAGSLGASMATRSRYVTVPVQAGHLPDSLARGDLVDVYLTPKTGSGAAVPTPTLVLAAVPVEDRTGGSRTFSASSAFSVVLAVPLDNVAAVVHAVESGTVDLVVVPRADAGAGGPTATVAP